MSYLYKNNEKVQVLPVELDSVNNADNSINKFSIKKELPILKVGFELEKKINKPFYMAFYKQLNLSYKISYKFFDCPSDNELEEKLYSHLLDKFNIQNKKYILVHDESSVENYILDIKSNLKQINLTKEYDIFNNIFLYKKIIRDAEEIHCINSSFAHLIDRIDTKGKLIYHDIRGSRIKLKKNWKYKNYGN